MFWCGSTSLATDANGAKITDSETRYYPSAAPSADTIVPSPGNPQSLNRYAYVLNNPVRYTDPSGHLTEEQIRQWVTHDFDSLDTRIRQMLLALHFGDILVNSEKVLGTAGLGDNGLQFSDGDNTYLIEDIIAMREEGLGLALGRTGPDGTLYLAHPGQSTTGYPSISELGQCTESAYRVGSWEQFLASTLPSIIRDGVVGAGIGLVAGGGPQGAVWGFWGGVGYDLLATTTFADPMMGHAEGDTILQYRYSSSMYMQEVIIRGTEVDVSWRMNPQKFDSGAPEAPYF